MSRSEDARDPRADRSERHSLSSFGAVESGVLHESSAGADGPRVKLDPTLGEEDDAAALLEFVQAMEHYKKVSGRLFPTWSEVLEVLQGLGYQKPPQEGDLPSLTPPTE